MRQTFSADAKNSTDHGLKDTGRQQQPCTQRWCTLTHTLLHGYNQKNRPHVLACFDPCRPLGADNALSAVPISKIPGFPVSPRCVCPFGIHFLCSFDPRLTARRSLHRAKGLSHFHVGLFGKWSHTEEDQPLLFPLFSKPTWVLLSQKHGTCLSFFFTHLFSAVTRLAATTLVPFIFVRYRRVIYFPRQMESACVCVCLCARWRFSLPQWHGASFAAIPNALAAFASDDIGQSIFHYKLWQFYYVHYELLAALCSWGFFCFVLCRCCCSILLFFEKVTLSGSKWTWLEWDGRWKTWNKSKDKLSFRGAESAGRADVQINIDDTMAVRMNIVHICGGD